MFVPIKTQSEKPHIPDSGFLPDQFMHLHIDFYRLVLPQDRSYIKFSVWIAKKKVVINSRNNNEQCFKWAVIATLHHEDFARDLQSISKLLHDENQYNWNGFEFQLPNQKIGLRRTTLIS